MRALWRLHRVGYAISGGRLGLRVGADDRLGTLRLHTMGRRSGTERTSMLYYLPAGTAYAVVASNAGAAKAPAWWLNLQARPDAAIDLPSGTFSVRARAAELDERAHLWPRFVKRLADYEKYAAATEREIPIVMLEPTDRGG